MGYNIYTYMVYSGFNHLTTKYIISELNNQIYEDSMM